MKNKKQQTTAFKAWNTIRSNKQKRSDAAKKANRTRKLSARAKKAWVTRRLKTDA